MVNSTETPTPDQELAAAEVEAAEAEQLLQSLEEAVIAGDATVTPDDITRQDGLSRFARLRVEATRRKAAEAAVAARKAAIASIRDEVAADVATDSDELLEAFESAHAASVEFFNLAAAHNARLDSWRTRLQQLGVEENRHEHGVGLNGIQQVVIDGVALERVEGARFLNMLFTGQADSNSGQLEPAKIVDGSRIQAAIDVLKALRVTK